MIRETLLLKGKQNNFDFLRFFAALMVFFGHSFLIVGKDFYKIDGYFGQYAVDIFFTISGFLIVRSWIMDPHLFSYFKKRCLRIFPGLLVVLLFTVFILGPLVTTESLGSYFSNSQTYTYLRNVFLVPLQLYLPGVFTNSPWEPIVNGSIWTLALEFIAYSAVAFLGMLGLFRIPFFSFITLGLLLGVDLYFRISDIPVYARFSLEWVICTRFLIYFNIGAIFYLYSDRVPLKKSMFLAALALFFAFPSSSLNQYITYLTLPYMVIYFAYADIPFLKNFSKYGDLSYGIYIYGCPIQQSIVYLLGRESFAAYFVCSFAATIFCAYLSWHLIEKPCLNFKNKKIRLEAVSF